MLRVHLKFLTTPIILSKRVIVVMPDTVAERLVNAIDLDRWRREQEHAKQRDRSNDAIIALPIQWPAHSKI
jgi:hypothetical protein